MVRLWKKGFTIIELLIVITVIAILIGIALPRFRGIQDEGNIAKARGELKTLQTGVESYLMHQGSLPAGLSDLVKDTTKPNLVGSVLPTDPWQTQSNNYGYKTAGTSYYLIWTKGPSGVAPDITADGKISVPEGCDGIYASNGKPTT